eukprot:c4739_g1_i1.p1 GENE.c4739_g1_i1~~c4739_g1_i1.p1  ORF type:complete len:165 (-),score=42.49 c4739_g1_i1:150-617(-)
MPTKTCLLVAGLVVLMMAHATTAFDESGFSLPVLRSLMQESQGTSSKDNDNTMKSILPMMMMMSQRKHAYHGMGYMGGVYGLGPSYSPFGFGAGVGAGVGGGFGGMGGGGFGGMPFVNAMTYPLYQAHMMQANPFLNPTNNPFVSAFNPSGYTTA